MNHFIYGAGGHGKVVLDAMKCANFRCDGFIDQKLLVSWAGLSVFDEAFLKSKDRERQALHIAIGDCATREKISKNMSDANFFSVYHPNAIVSPTSEIQDGCFLAAGSIVGPDARIGIHCIINHHAVVDHDCSVGEFCHIAPHVSLGGGVKVGKAVLVGTGAIVLPGLVIGDRAVVGAGAIVTKDVLSGSTVVGNPARATEYSPEC